MLKTTLGQLLVNDVLPRDLQDYSRTLDKKNSGKLFQEIAARYPEQYKDISKKLSDIGRRASTESGGFSFGLDSLVTPDSVKQIRYQLQAEIDNVLADKSLDTKARQDKIVALTSARTKEIQDKTYEETVKAKNPLAMQVVSGARGNPGNLRSVLAGDLLYEDHKNRIIPIPVLRSYSEGLTPAEYWAGSYGARKGVVDLKLATADAGYFGKQLNQITHRLLVHSLDDKNYDGSIRGVPINTDDPDNEGAFLAHDTGGYKRNTQLTPKVLADLKAKGQDRILIRSPLVGGHPDGGLYAYDVGVRERGGLPAPGDNVGMAAAQSLSEQTSQSQISSKHLGGVAGAGGAISGFKYINQLVQIPKTFTGGATHADTDGKVSAVYNAPAGGKYVMIAGKRHFVHAGQEPNIKAGDVVEAGDVISSGLPNPSKIVEHKGVGEGRRYFVDIMRKVYQDSGLKAHRRNIELLSRGLINHVELDEEIGDFVPGDKVSYDVIEHNYQPRPDHRVTPIKSAAGQYLEKPILHYTIGTRLQPSMIKEMEKFGVKNVMTHREPPPFKPIMIQGRYNLLHDQDWMTRQLGMDLKKGLLDSTHRGLVSDPTGSSFVPALAEAKNFGRVGMTKSWDPKQVIKTQVIRPEHEQFEDYV